MNEKEKFKGSLNNNDISFFLKAFPRHSLKEITKIFMKIAYIFLFKISNYSVNVK